MTHDLLGIPATYLPPDPAADASPDTDSAIVAAAHPASSLAWAVLAEDALAREEWVAAYAYARTGYHRGLDQLRRHGWKGTRASSWATKVIGPQGLASQPPGAYKASPARPRSRGDAGRGARSAERAPPKAPCQGPRRSAMSHLGRPLPHRRDVEKSNTSAPP